MKILNSTLNSAKTLYKNHRWKIVIGFIIIITGGGLLYTQASSQPEEIQTISPEYRDLTKTLDLSGTVDAKKRARLRFLAGGKVIYLGAQEGDWVQAWQTIASIDARDLQKRLERSLNQYMQQRWDWEQLLDDTGDYHLKELEERRYIDKQQWNLDNSVIEVELQDIAISQSRMAAPFAGILISSPISTANTQVTGNDYFELVDPVSLIFRAQINEEDISLINLEQPAQIILDAYLDEKLNSQISFISYQSSQAASGTVFQVEFPLVNIVEVGTDNLPALLAKYRLGMNGDVQIVLEKRNDVLSIPLITTISRDGKNFVEVLKDGEAEMREVSLGIETDEYVEVLSGLDPKIDRVILPRN